MIVIYQVYKILSTESRDGNRHYTLSPFWRDSPEGGNRFPWVPFFDSRDEAIEFINEQNRGSGEYTILEVFTGRRPYELPKPEPRSYS